MIKHDKMILYWEGGKFTKQIDLDKESNCGFIQTIPSYQKYNKFAVALNSHIEQSNDKWHDIEKPMSFIENQTEEEI